MLAKIAPVPNQSAVLTVLKTKRRARPGHFKADIRRSLSDREIQIARFLCDGNSSKKIAQNLGLSIKTVDTHRANILSKLELHSTVLLVRWAIRHGIVKP